MPRLSKSTIDTLAIKSAKYTVWDQGDRAVKGFGLTVYPSGKKSYVFNYRNSYGQLKRQTIGRHGELTPEKARQIAKRLEGEVCQGSDPLANKQAKRQALKVNAVIDEYLKSEAFLSKAEATRKNDIGRLDRHIRPLLGGKIAETLSSEEIRRTFAAIRDGKTAADVKTGPRGRALVRGGEGAARMAIRNLRALFNWAVSQKLLTTNPAAGVPIGTDGVRDAVLTTADDYTRLFRSLDSLEDRAAIRPPVADAIRVLALTGARRNEIAALRWSWVDLERGLITLPPEAHKTGKKTGARQIALPSAAQQIIAQRPAGAPGDYVFPPAKGAGPVTLSKPWRLVRSEAQLPEDMGLHGLRHSLATLMATQGAAAPEIMAALGHRQLATAGRYIKTVEDARRSSVQKHTAGIAAALNATPPADVKPIGGKS